jgi:hypothetical protein
MTEERRKYSEVYNRGVDDAFMELAKEIMENPKDDYAIQWNNHISRVMRNIRMLKIMFPEPSPQSPETLTQ